MNEYAWVSVIAMVGWLVLAIGSYRSHRVGARKTLTMALAWGAVFLLAAAIFAAVAP